jgi:hypothetical protein
VVEYQDRGWDAVMALNWRLPGAANFTVVPITQLYTDTTTPAPSNVPPTVSVTSPSAGASFVQGTAITVSANAADTDGTVSQVQFYDGTTLIGTDTTAPYSISWSNAAVGGHSITARATDNSNAITTSAAVSISVTEDPANPPPPPASGTGLLGTYYATNDLSGNVVLERLEQINFNWGEAQPHPDVPKDNFSIRWTGYIEATTAGTYQLQTYSDDGVRVYLDNALIINNWTAHSATLDNSASFTMSAGQRLPIVVEYQDRGWDAVMALNWRLPGAANFTVVPITQLYTDTTTP